MAEDAYRAFLPGSRAFVIAEAGVNHNGRLSLALRLVDAAKKAGADAVKFQTFNTEAVITRNAEKADYQVRSTGGSQSQFDMVKALELSRRDHEAIVARCHKVGILFCSTPFDPPSVDLLEKLDVPFFKLSSGEVTNHPLLAYTARKKRPILLSTGMCTLNEVRDAVKTLYSAGNRRIVLLHCVTEYPAPAAASNLRAMQTLGKAFGLPVGFSDHSLGCEVSLAAVALGARVIEKHMTLDRGLPGPDHEASMIPGQFASLVQGIRDVESSLGDGIKRPAACELKNIPIVRRSLVAARDITRGERITLDLIAYKRPGTGIMPKFLPRVLRLRAAADIRQDELLSWRKLRA